MVLGWISSLINKLIAKLEKLFFTAVWKLIIGIVAVIYAVAYYLYQIFLALANVNVFDGKLFETIVSKLYIVIGVVTLFALAYNLLTYVIDPNKNKSGAEIEKLIKNTVTSFIMIILCPLVFKYAIEFQQAVLTQNLIGKIFSEQDISKASNDNDMSNRVSSISVQIFREFFVSTGGKSLTNGNTGKNAKCEGETVYCKEEGKCEIGDVDDYVNCSGDFSMYKAFAWNVHKETIDFNWFIGAAVGIYLCYVLVCFCFDMAERQVKLVFYQILSPICISCRLIPSKEGVFKTWGKSIFKTWVSVFTRLALLCISVLLIEKINDSWASSLSSEMCKNIKCSPGVQTFAKIFLILACVTFLKEGAKLICELFGLDDVGFGLKEKGGFKAALGAGAAVSAGFKGMKHGFSSGVESFKKSKGKGFMKRAGSFADIGGKALRRGASASMRSLSASTDGFGINGYKRELDKLKDNRDEAVQAADLKSLAWKDKSATVKQIWDERKDLELLKKRIKEKIEQKKAIEADELYKLAVQAKIKLDKIDSEIASNNKTLTRMQSEADLAKQKLERLIFEGASDGEIAKAQKELDKITNNLNAFKAKAAQKQKERDSVDAELDTYSSAIKAERGMTFDELQDQMGDLDKEISGLIEESADFKFTQVKEDFSTRITQEWTGIDQSRAQELVTQYNDRIKDATKKIISKYGSKIEVDMTSALSKNSTFAANASKIATAIATHSYTVEDITGIAQKLSTAQNWTQVKGILPDDVRTAMSINENNWAQVASSFANVVNEPYSKEVNKAVTDAITSGDEGFKYEGSTEPVFRKADAHTIMSDLDAKDVSRKKYAYDVLHFELYGTAAPKTSGERKKLEDELRKKNAANDRAKSSKQVLSDVKSTSTKGNKSDK